MLWFNMIEISLGAMWRVWSLFISQLGVLKGNDRKYVVNKNSDK